MKNLMCLLATLLFSHVALAEMDGVYGQDNRMDVYQSSNAMLKTLAKSTAAMIPMSLFAKAATQGLFNLNGTKTLEDAENICPSEAFAAQPTAAICSGFLVAPDVLVTAGHCYNSFSTPDNICKSFAWVFDFNMASAKSDPTKNLSGQNIYLCKQIIKSQFDKNGDFSIIRLNRAVTGRSPLKLRTTGKLSSSASLVVIGNPTGLPTKISDGGKVGNNSDARMFVTNLDTFHGNSGSAVFDLATGVVEGILVQGKTDYIPSNKNDPKSCQVVNKCDENGDHCTAGNETTPPGEMVYRITNITQFLK
jgi:V8-like Glu-specific endopeptidase